MWRIIMSNKKIAKRVSKYKAKFGRFPIVSSSDVSTNKSKHEYMLLIQAPASASYDEICGGIRYDDSLSWKHLFMPKLKHFDDNGNIKLISKYYMDNRHE